ncbi:hypothetical protein [Fluoribacter gormanii]|uniref:hypothetical protein n=1 Tax=Fluoribacter gormanii TaxID=464 RepID=UPI00104131B5|nr:hypothetical protein [Fluoribacter gormanii]
MLENEFSEKIVRFAKAGDSLQVDSIIDEYIKSLGNQYPETEMANIRKKWLNLAVQNYAINGHFGSVNSAINRGANIYWAFSGYKESNITSQRDKLIEVLAQTENINLRESLINDAKLNGIISHKSNIRRFIDQLRVLMMENEFTFTQAMIYIKMCDEKSWLLQGIQTVTHLDANKDKINLECVKLPMEIYHLINSFVFNCQIGDSEKIYAITNERFRKNIVGVNFAGGLTFFRKPTQDKSGEHAQVNQITPP